MSVQLPLEPLATLGEHTHLARDQLVELGSLDRAEVAVADEAAVLRADHAHERAVHLGVNTLGQIAGHLGTKLLVVRSEQRADIAEVA